MPFKFAFLKISLDSTIDDSSSSLLLCYYCILLAFFVSSNPSYIGSQSSLDNTYLESFVAVLRIFNGLVVYYIMSKFLCMFLMILQNWALIILHHEQLALHCTPPSSFSPDHFPLVTLCLLSSTSLPWFVLIFPEFLLPYSLPFPFLKVYMETHFLHKTFPNSAS